jgi:mannitol operon transcriptional antiterminator
VFMVLATVDNESHLKALSALSDIIGNDDDLALIKEGDVDVIYNLLGKGGV